jgi:hypothetical protein
MVSLSKIVSRFLKFKNNFILKKTKPLRIGTFGLLNNPNYREEPWRENITQRLDFFDVVCLVCGYEKDIAMLQEAFPVEFGSGKLRVIYKLWPFPEWSYDEIPQHLNATLNLAREASCDWAIRLDVDSVFHEKDYNKVRSVIAKAERKGKWIVSFGKLQFFKPTQYWSKSNVPLGLRMNSPIVYGFDQTQYTDLAQPIEWDEVSKFSRDGVVYNIPSGRAVSRNKIHKVRGISVFNYDYTYRTFDRSVELLYQIEMAHARFWGKGYSGLPLSDITRETAMKDFLQTATVRYPRMSQKMDIGDHPKFFQASLKELDCSKWGFDMWDKIK